MQSGERAARPVDAGPSQPGSAQHTALPCLVEGSVEERKHHARREGSHEGVGRRRAGHRGRAARDAARHQREGRAAKEGRCGRVGRVGWGWVGCGWVRGGAADRRLARAGTQSAALGMQRAGSALQHARATCAHHVPPACSRPLTHELVVDVVLAAPALHEGGHAGVDARHDRKVAGLQAGTRECVHEAGAVSRRGSPGCRLRPAGSLPNPVGAVKPRAQQLHATVTQVPGRLPKAAAMAHSQQNAGRRRPPGPRLCSWCAHIPAQKGLPS